MPYVECPSCGKTALRVASRCPHCGLLFSPGVLPPAEPNRLPRRLLIGGALAAFVALVLVARNLSGPRAAAPRLAPAAAAPAAAVPAEQRPEPPVAPVAPPVRVEPPAAAAPRAAPPPPVPTGEEVQRYATTWVNVRDRRGPNATSVRVLDPGEAILVDSLVGGWYRVVIDGQSIGYAYGSNLSETAP